jgi:hypothetical protein
MSLHSSDFDPASSDSELTAGWWCDEASGEVAVGDLVAAVEK